MEFSTAAVAADGSYTYTPPAGYSGADSFDYTVTDGSRSVAGSASLDITPVNDAPTTTPVTLVAIAEDNATFHEYKHNHDNCLEGAEMTMIKLFGLN